jgi:hypothetical protein
VSNLPSVVTSDPSNLTLREAIKLAMEYKGAKNALHMALVASIGQLIKGNPDWLSAIFRAGELIKHKVVFDKGDADSKRDSYLVHGDGQVVWGYLRAHLGLGDLVRWDTTKGRFKMREGWSETAGKLDLVAIWGKMSTVRWDKWNAKPAEEVFDPEKVVAAMLKRLNAHGIAPAAAIELVSKVAKAA